MSSKVLRYGIRETAAMVLGKETLPILSSVQSLGIGGNCPSPACP